MSDENAKRGTTLDEGFLDGKLLLAMPSMSDPRFHRAVIYMCAHSDDGAMGIVINHAAPSITFTNLLEQLGIIDEDDDEGDSIRLPVKEMTVHTGGPVEMGRGFVLHTTDYFSADSTLTIDDSVSLTATVDILRAIAAGKGPMRSLLALGYAGWAPGQLESELQMNGWLLCDSDAELVFGDDDDRKWDRALRKIGVDPSMLGAGGHA